jgi:penicillin-binding protein 1A
VVQPQQVDPVTGYPLQQQNQAVPIDPETGLPMQLVVDPATGEQVWVPSAPAQMTAPTQFAPQPIQPPQPVGQQPVYQQERSQRTLMDLIFGG